MSPSDAFEQCEHGNQCFYAKDQLCAVARFQKGRDPAAGQSVSAVWLACLALEQTSAVEHMCA